MSGDEGDKAKGVGAGGEYGTFQGPPTYPPPRPPVVVYHSGAVQDAEAGVRGHRNDRLPCCGLGIGWVLFIAGFFVTIPWYVGSVLLCFYREEKREKPGFIACTIAAVILTVLIIVVAILDAVLVHD